MKKFLMLGDTHGDLDFLGQAALIAAENDADIIQLGDWGFVWPKSDQLATVQVILERAGELNARPPVTMRFIDGNHDDHTWLAKIAAARPEAKRRTPAQLTPNVIYQPRGSVYEDEDGTRFVFCGGAPSIDYRHRREGYSWWEKEEVISDEDFEAVMYAWHPYATTHVLVTHDAAEFPPDYGPKGTPEFQARGERSMEMIGKMIERHQPTHHFHGHWHTRASTQFGSTRVEAIAANVNRFTDAMLLWGRDA